MNGYASYTVNKDRYIVLHAGIKVILSRLGTFISNIVWRRSRMADFDTLKVSLISLAKFVGSKGLDGSLVGAWLPQSVDHAEEIASSFIDGIQSITIRETQIKWILAHECAHHNFNHLEKIEIDLHRCNNIKDAEHYRLRQELEFEADLKAS